VNNGDIDNDNDVMKNYQIKKEKSEEILRKRESLEIKERRNRDN
jgi:hypothetical protein